MKNNKTLLQMQLLLRYYKNNNINRPYYSLIDDNRLIMDCDVLNTLENLEPIYIEPYYKREKTNRKIRNAIEAIDLIKPELWNISNAMTYKLIDIKNILEGEQDD